MAEQVSHPPSSFLEVIQYTHPLLILNGVKTAASHVQSAASDIVSVLDTPLPLSPPLDMLLVTVQRSFLLY